MDKSIDGNIDYVGLKDVVVREEDIQRGAEYETAVGFRYMLLIQE